MKITGEQIAEAMRKAGLEVQYFPFKLVSAAERKPHTCGSIDLNDIAAAVSAIPGIAMIESVQAIGVKNGKETELVEIPIPNDMKAQDIAKSYGMGNIYDDNTDGSCVYGAMQELLKWLEQQGRLK